MPMLLRDPAELQRLHYEHEHQCCWIVDGETRCGLWCGHDGDHIPHQIGDYLTITTPVIHPLDMLRLNSLMRAEQWNRLRCPLCGAGQHSFGLTLDCEGLIGRFYDDEDHGGYERLWRFEPCGCEGREILPNMETA